MRVKWMGGLMVVAMVLILNGCPGGSGMGVSIVRDIEFPEGDDARPVRIILPENFDQGGDLLPLILHLHGAVPFEDAREVEMENSGYRDLPSKYRVIVVAPQATLNADSGNFDWDSFGSLLGCGTTNADDVGFLNDLIDRLLEDYPVDPQRIYIYGYSSGAAMAHRMACENAERFAGIVAGAGFTLGAPELCAPSVPISVLQFHSEGDEVVLFNGGNFASLVGETENPSACDYPGAVELLTRWANLNGCAGELQDGNEPTYDLTTPGFADPPGIEGGVEGKETTVRKFQQCPNGIDVELWEMAEGVPHPPLFFRVGPNGIKVLAEESWKFLQGHTR